jgi:methylenetetrahydrofolate--tRNA-(uracil-5-)-methyltransferase
LGALLHYITHADLKDFQPMKANYGILPDLKKPSRGKRERAMQYATRGLHDLKQWAQAVGLSAAPERGKII